MKIKKITKEAFKGDVYNLELNSNRIEDDLYWIEGNTGVITHNCFPKDMAAILNIADILKRPIPTLLGASTTNSIVRKNRDWEEMKGRAVSENEEWNIVEELDNTRNEH